LHAFAVAAGSGREEEIAMFRQLLLGGASVLMGFHLALAEPANPLALPTDAEVKASASIRLMPTSAPAGTAAPADERLAEMNRRYRAVDFQPELKAVELGGGIEPAFNYVRDQIAFEAYPGVFRGATGAYASRAANAADRSLLLAELLKAKGIATRFALGRLSDENANILFKRIFEARPPAASQAAATPQGAQFLQQLRARADRDYGAILAALGGKIPAGAGSGRDALLKEISSHVWLQAHLGDQWVDLDSAFADATVGRRYGQSPQTVESLPDDAYQRVTIRVVAETLEGAALKREIVLELTRPVVSLVDRQVFLIHSPESALQGLSHAVGSGGKNAYLPALWVDGEVFGGKAIAFNDAASLGGGGGKIDSVLDALGGAQPPTTAPRFVSESLEFELVVPGRPPEVTRRILCDLGGAAWRLNAPLDVRQLRDLPRNENGPIAVQTIHNVWFSAGSHDMASYAQCLGLLAQSLRSTAAAPTASDHPRDFGEQVWPLAIKNLSWVLWGEHQFLPALNDTPAARFYLDSPRIVLFSFSAAIEKGTKDRFSMNTQVDLRRDRIRGVWQPPADGSAAVARRKIWFAVLEGALEHELTTQEAAAFNGDVRVESTSGLLDDRGAVALTGPAPATGWEALATDRETAARLHDALGPGKVLVVPRKVLEGGESGWWGVDLETGDTQPVLGYGTNGSGLSSNGGYARGGGYGGSSGGNVNYVDPKTGNSYSPRRTSRTGGNEYTTVLVTVSIPSGIAFAGLMAGVASIIWIIIKVLF